VKQNTELLAVTVGSKSPSTGLYFNTVFAHEGKGNCPKVIKKQITYEK